MAGNLIAEGLELAGGVFLQFVSVDFTTLISLKCTLYTGKGGRNVSALLLGPLTLLLRDALTLTHQGGVCLVKLGTGFRPVLFRQLRNPSVRRLDRFFLVNSL